MSRFKLKHYLLLKSALQSSLELYFWLMSHFQAKNIGSTLMDLKLKFEAT